MWGIELHPEVDRWLLDPARAEPVSADLVESAIDFLAERGPQLGRPLVDRVKRSRCAVLLVAGDKAGSWNGGYDANLPLAEQRYDEHLADTEKG